MEFARKDQHGADPHASASGSSRWHVAALLLGNILSALGPVLVRLCADQAGIGPIAAGFWRMALAVPMIGVAALFASNARLASSRRDMALALATGIVFACDLAIWHLGIARTRLANAALLGNSASLFLPAWGFLVWRIRPTDLRLASLAIALLGAVVLLGRSFELGGRGLGGDLLCLLAGALYTAYLVAIDNVRGRMGAWPILLLTTLGAAPTLFALAAAAGETILPVDWTAPVALALLVQVVGQALLILAISRVDAVLVGVALLSQPVVGAAIGWSVFDEQLTWVDGVGTSLICASIILLARASPASPRP